MLRFVLRPSRRCGITSTTFWSSSAPSWNWPPLFALMALCHILHRPAVVWRCALPDQPPTVIMPMVAEDVNVKPLYLMMDERYRGCEHFDPLLLTGAAAGTPGPAAAAAPPPTANFVVKGDKVFLDVKSHGMVLAAAGVPAPCADALDRGKQHPASYVRAGQVEAACKRRPAGALARPAVSLEPVHKKRRQLLCSGFDGPDGNVPCSFAEDGLRGARCVKRAGQRCIFCSPDSIDQMQNNTLSRGPLIKILKHWAQHSTDRKKKASMQISLAVCRSWASRTGARRSTSRRSRRIGPTSKGSSSLGGTGASSTACAERRQVLQKFRTVRHASTNVAKDSKGLFRLSAVGSGNSIQKALCFLTNVA